MVIRGAVWMAAPTIRYDHHLWSRNSMAMTPPAPRRRVVRIPVTELIATRNRRTTAAPVAKPMNVSASAIRIDPEDISEAFSSALRALPPIMDAHRSGDYLHVSALLGQCLRLGPLSAALRMPVADARQAEGLALTFHTGVSIHEFVRQRLARMRRIELHGNWTCRCGYKRVERATAGSIVEAGICPKCETLCTEYEEVQIRNDDLMVTGSPDTILYMQKHNAYMPGEIKSIAHDAWKEIVRPQPDHLLQNLFYWYLMQEEGYPMLPCMVIIYVTKGYAHNMPYKPFYIDPSTALSRLEPYFAEARARKAAIAVGKVPPRVLCKSDTSGAAKTCPLRIPCFDEALDDRLSY